MAVSCLVRLLKHAGFIWLRDELVGVATGGGAGMALAHTIINGAPPMDLHEADPKRFDASVNTVAALSARVPEVLGKHYEITYPGRQWQTARGIKTLPLHERWVSAKAYFGQVFGYERPLYFNCTAPPKLTLASLSGLIRSAPKSRSRAMPRQSPN